MKKQARNENEAKAKKLQLHRETLRKLFSGESGATVTQYTCPDNTSGTCVGGCVG